MRLSLPGARRAAAVGLALAAGTAAALFYLHDDIPADALVLSYSSDSADWDVRSEGFTRAGRLVTGTLLRTTSRGQTQPYVAAELEQDPNAPTDWLVTLNPDRPRFSDGSQVTADDVAASVLAVADKDGPSPLAGVFAAGGFRGAEVVSPTVVRVRFAAVWAPARAYLGEEVGVWPRAVLDQLRDDKDAFGGDRALKLVGCGPYRLVKYRAKKVAVFDPVAGGERLGVRFQKPDAAATDMKAGRVDFVYANPSLQPLFRRVPGVTVVEYDYWEPITVAQNLAPGTPTGDHAALREAVVWVVDAEAVRTQVASPAAEGQPAGTGTLPAAGKLFAAAHDRFNAPDAATLAAGFDPARARAALDRAGFALRDGRRHDPAGNPLRLRLVSHRSIDEYPSVCDRLAAVLRHHLGVEVEVKLLPAEDEFTDFLARSGPGTWDLFVGEYPYRALADPSLAQSVSSQAVPPGGRNFPRLTLPAVDAAVAEADRTSDPGARAAAFHRLHRELLRANVVKPLYFARDAWCVSPRVAADAADPNIKRTLERFPETLRLRR